MNEFWTRFYLGRSESFARFYRFPDVLCFDRGCGLSDWLAVVVCIHRELKQNTKNNILLTCNTQRTPNGQNTIKTMFSLTSHAHKRTTAILDLCLVFPSIFLVIARRHVPPLSNRNVWLLSLSVLGLAAMSLLAVAAEFDSCAYAMSTPTETRTHAHAHSYTTTPRNTQHTTHTQTGRIPLWISFTLIFGVVVAF